MLSHQPMFSADRKVAVTYNGEVYNFRELRTALEKLGHIFKTRSDTEVVLNAYLEWGSDCLTRFRGMFAFALIDERRRRAFLARDRVGKKPLFYALKKDVLFFSSEIESLYLTVGPFKMDLEALDDYLAWQYVPAPKTIYREVVCLPPAHFLDVDMNSGKVETRRYWSLRFSEDRSLDDVEWERRIDEKLDEAVKIRLISDVPYGAFLSGGVDSSLVVWHMAKNLDHPVKTFSISFREDKYDESQYATAAAKLCGAEHHSRFIEADAFGVLPHLVRHYGQPFADSSAIPTYYVSKMARENVKMVLSGDGGDEVFAGYNTYENIVTRLNGAWIPSPFRGVSRALGSICRFLAPGRGNWPSNDILSLHSRAYQHFSIDDRRALYGPLFKDSAVDRMPERKAILESSDQPALSRLQLLDVLTYLPFDILTKIDIASMANALEVRSPFLDHELIEVAATLPSDLKFKRRRGLRGPKFDRKYLLKRLARRRFPENMVDRPKWGFGIPLGQWFLGKLRAEVRRRLLHSPVLEMFFDRRQIEQLIESHSPTRDMSAKIWNLLFLEEWMRTHDKALVQN